MLKTMKRRYYFTKCKFYLVLSGINIAALKALQSVEEFLHARIKENIEIIKSFKETEESES